ncbi:hypothetical protein Tco_1506268 [Tanacetum coccineum]
MDMKVRAYYAARGELRIEEDGTVTAWGPYPTAISAGCSLKGLCTMRWGTCRRLESDYRGFEPFPGRIVPKMRNQNCGKPDKNMNGNKNWKPDEGKYGCISLSCTKTKSIFEKGCQVYLAQVTSKKLRVSGREAGIEVVPIVREFPEVFLEELPGLPPTRQVEFQIDLVPGAAPVARAPSESSPWEHRFLFVKKKMVLFGCVRLSGLDNKAYCEESDTYLENRRFVCFNFKGSKYTLRFDLRFWCPGHPRDTLRPWKYQRDIIEREKMHDVREKIRASKFPVREWFEKYKSRDSKIKRHKGNIEESNGAKGIGTKWIWEWEKSKEEHKKQEVKIVSKVGEKDVRRIKVNDEEINTTLFNKCLIGEVKSICYLMKLPDSEQGLHKVDAGGFFSSGTSNCDVFKLFGIVLFMVDVLLSGGVSCAIGGVVVCSGDGDGGVLFDCAVGIDTGVISVHGVDVGVVVGVFGVRVSYDVGFVG